MKIVFLEGLPGVGKSTLIDNIRLKSYDNVHVVNEIVLDSKQTDQKFFMDNDIAKISKYNQGTIIIDRGLISTLSYNMVLKIINNSDYNLVSKWFKKNAVNMYKQENVITYYLKTNKYIVKNNNKNKNNPYSSVKNLKTLEKITINNIKKYCLNYKIVEYSYDKMEELINEIIN